MYNAGLYMSSKGIDCVALHQIRDRYFEKRLVEPARINMDRLRLEKTLREKK